MAYPLFWISPPPRLEDLRLSDAAEELVALAWRGLDPARVIDAHVHVIGLGRGDTGCFVHADNLSLTSPVRYVKTRFYKGAAGIYDDSRADALFVERLVDLCRYQTPRPRHVLLAFDQHYTTAGEPVDVATEFYTPNEYVFDLCRRHPDLFLAGCSVHPYPEPTRWRS